MCCTASFQHVSLQVLSVVLRDVYATRAILSSRAISTRTNLIIVPQGGTRKRSLCGMAVLCALCDALVH